MCGRHFSLQDMLHTAVRSGCKLFSHSLPGSSILLKDSINAVECLLTSSTKNSLPRNEALFLLGSLLCLPDQYTRVPVISDGVEVCVSEGVKLKEQLIQLLYRLAKTEPFRNSRCLAIFQLGLLLFIELQADRASPRIPEGIDILLATLQVHVQFIVQLSKRIKYLNWLWERSQLLEASSSKCSPTVID